MQNTMAELQNRLLLSQAATAEAVRESEFEKRVAQAINLSKADTDLQRLGGALSGAAAAGARDRGTKAVHFDEGQGNDSDEGRKKKKEKKRKKSSKKKKKKHSSDSDSESSTTTGTSDSRRSRQRGKREKGANLAQATQSGSGHIALASSGQSPDPKGAALVAMLNARNKAYITALNSGLSDTDASAVAMAAYGQPQPRPPALPINLAIPQPTPVSQPLPTPRTETSVPKTAPATKPPAPKVIPITPAEMSASYKPKAKWGTLTLQLVKHGVVEPETAHEMTKTEVLVAAADAHNAGHLNLRKL